MDEFLKYIQAHTGVTDMLAAFTFLVAAIYAWRDLNWRVKNLESWQAKLDALMEKQVTILTSTDKNTTVLQEIAKTTERRLCLIEDLHQRRVE